MAMGVVNCPLVTSGFVGVAVGVANGLDMTNDWVGVAVGVTNISRCGVIDDVENMLL